MYDCVRDCITRYVKDIGWLALAIVVTCIISLYLSGGLTAPAVLACLGITLGGATAQALLACIFKCFGKTIAASTLEVPEGH